MSFLLGLVSRTGVTEQSLKPIYKGWKPSASQAGLRGGYFECLLVLCASMLAASGSSAVAGSFMCSLVVLCRKMRVNPGKGDQNSIHDFALIFPCLADNVATPVASCLGDLLTLTILGLVSAAFGRIEGAFSRIALYTWPSISTHSRGFPFVCRHDCLHPRLCRSPRIPRFRGYRDRTQCVRPRAFAERLDTSVYRYGHLKVCI